MKQVKLYKPQASPLDSHLPNQEFAPDWPFTDQRVSEPPDKRVLVRICKPIWLITLHSKYTIRSSVTDQIYSYNHNRHVSMTAAVILCSIAGGTVLLLHALLGINPLERFLAVSVVFTAAISPLQSRLLKYAPEALDETT